VQRNRKTAAYDSTMPTTSEPGLSTAANAQPLRSEADLLAEFLAQRDVPCPVCRYNLRASPSSACPECGSKLDLRVGSVNVRVGLWLTAVLAVAIPLGLTGTLSVIMFIATCVAWGGGNDAWDVAWLCWGTVIVQAIFLAVVIRKRRAFWKQSRSGRTAWMVVILLASAALTAAFIWAFIDLVA
jgi:hypothetical protein